MVVYIITKDGVVFGGVFTGLRSACKAARVSYDSASRGKRVWLKEDSVIRIWQSDVVKARPRGSGF